MASYLEKFLQFIIDYFKDLVNVIWLIMNGIADDIFLRKIEERIRCLNDSRDHLSGTMGIDQYYYRRKQIQNGLPCEEIVMIPDSKPYHYYDDMKFYEPSESRFFKTKSDNPEERQLSKFKLKKSFRTRTSDSPKINRSKTPTETFKSVETNQIKNEDKSKLFQYSFIDRIVKDTGKSLQDQIDFFIVNHACNLGRESIYLDGDLYLEKVPELMSGILNSGRYGRILHGIKENSLIKGILLSRRDRDFYRREFDSILKTKLKPRLIPDLYSLTFIPCKERNEISNTKFVVEIFVRGSSDTRDKYEVSKRGKFIWKGNQIVERLGHGFKYQ